MPNCDFFATAADHAPLLAWLFDENTCAVYEAYSPGEAPLRRFAGAAEVMREFEREGAYGRCHLRLHVNGSGPVPEPRRIDIIASEQAACGFRYRYTIEGWGLVPLQLYVPQMKKGQRQLDKSHTNHNSQKRAEAWADIRQGMNSPDAWDFRKVTAFSSRLNRQIRKRAVAKWGGCSILAGAWTEWENGTYFGGLGAIATAASRVVDLRNPA